MLAVVASSLPIIVPAFSAVVVALIGLYGSLKIGQLNQGVQIKGQDKTIQYLVSEVKRLQRELDTLQGEYDTLEKKYTTLLSQGQPKGRST